MLTFVSMRPQSILILYMRFEKAKKITNKIFHPCDNVITIIHCFKILLYTIQTEWHVSTSYVTSIIMHAVRITTYKL